MNKRKLFIRTAITIVFLMVIFLTFGCPNPLQEMIAQDLAESRAANLNLTIGSVGEGTTTPSGTLTVKENSSTSISASPGSGYEFRGWSIISGEGVNIEDETAAQTTVTLTQEDGSIQATFGIIDNVIPTCTISTPQNPTNSSPIDVSVDFSEPVSGFESADLEVTNASVSNFQSSDNQTYTFQLNPSSDPATITVTVPAGAAKDPGDNGNESATLDIMYDTSLLLATVETTGPNPTNANEIPFTVTFSEEVTGFELTDIYCSNGNAFNLISAANPSFTFSVENMNSGTDQNGKAVSITIPADSAISVRTGRGNYEAVLDPPVMFDQNNPDPPSTPDLNAADDTGSSDTDNITKNNSGLTISGSAEDGASVTISSDQDGQIGTATASGGSWSADVSLSETTHAVTATATDPAGNISTASTAITITVDLSPPTAPSKPDLAASDDTGSSDTDNVTSDGSGITFFGTADNNTAIELRSNITGTIGSTTSNGSGDWNAVVNLSETTHSITAVAMDVAGNEAVSSALSVTRDSTPPAGIPKILKPWNGTRTGTDLTPTFAWTAVAEADTYILQAATDSDFSPVVDYEWTDITGTSFEPSTDMSVSATAPVGSRYYFRMAAVDTAGNIGDWSNQGMYRYVDVGRFEQDMNGDGYSDIAIGAPGVIHGGAVYVFFGDNSTSGTIDTTSSDISVTGAYESEYYSGEALSLSGDINADGYSDLLIGSADADTVYILLGGSSVSGTYNYDNANIIEFSGSNYSGFGGDVTSVGDVNADGYDDVVVGAPPNEGICYLFYGASFITDTTYTSADETMSGTIYGGKLGMSVAGAGDVNGDGYHDVLISAPGQGNSPYEPGTAYLYFGGVAMTGSPDRTFVGEEGKDWFGISVNSAGDVNNDGYGDIVIGAYQYYPGETSTAGRAYIFSGGETMDTTADVIMDAESTSDYFGCSVSSAGDINEDGYSDVIIGAYLAPNGHGNNGRAYLYRGGSTMDNTEDLIFNGTSTSNNDDRFGCSVSVVGDFDADGNIDIIIGAKQKDGGGDMSGAAYIYYDVSSSSNTIGVTINGTVAGDFVGHAVE